MFGIPLYYLYWQIILVHCKTQSLLVNKFCLLTEVNKIFLLIEVVCDGISCRIHHVIRGASLFPVYISACPVSSAIIPQLETDENRLMPDEGFMWYVQTFFSYKVLDHVKKLSDIQCNASVTGRVGYVTMTMTVEMVLMRGSSATHSIRHAALQSLPARTSSVSGLHTGVMVKMTVVITLMKLAVLVSTSWLSVYWRLWTSGIVFYAG
jgi:hypothetical protein